MITTAFGRGGRIPFAPVTHCRLVRRVKALQECFLYAIVDLGYVEPARAAEVAHHLIQGGADLIQLRAKSVPKAEVAALGRDLHAVTRSAGVPLILNDHPDLLAELEAEGCHVGQEDASVADARRQAGRECIVGKSTHSPEQAVRAFQEGADYIGFGPIFATPTKPEAKAIGLSDLPAVSSAVNIPVFCIGGIKLSNLNEVLAAGADRVCIVSDLLQAANVLEKARSIKAVLRSAAIGGGG